MTLDHNQNYAVCIGKETWNLGSTVVHNICTGETTTVEWGLYGWFWQLFGVVAVITVAVFLIVAIRWLIKSA